METSDRLFVPGEQKLTPIVPYKGVTPNSELRPPSDTVLKETQKSLEANEDRVLRISAFNKRCCLFRLTKTRYILKDIKKDITNPQLNLFN